MIEFKAIDYETIFPFWREKLWKERETEITSRSAMLGFPGQYDGNNFECQLWCYGCFIDDQLVGVNSVHECTDNTLRSRGLWVEEEYRGKGIGVLLLKEAIYIGREHEFLSVWSFPKKTAWSVYQAAGFKITSDWIVSDTSEANAFCSFDLYE
jgi:GNAT superfamily N-acetyltransferase